MSFATIETVKTEIENITNLGVIEPSNSPYSSPVVLMPKPNCSKRYTFEELLAGTYGPIS